MIVEEEVDEEVEEFLEHFGIKGMHWGIRNKAKVVGRGIGRGAKSTGRFIRKHPKTTAGIAVAVTVGAIFAAKLITKNRAMKVSMISDKVHASGKVFTEQQMKAHRSGILKRHAARIANEQQLKSYKSYMPKPGR